VTKFILKSYPQGGIWVSEAHIDGQLVFTTISQGGYLFYPSSQLEAVKAAVIKFQDNKDTKATAFVSLSYSSGTVSAETYI
jgi:hypothetical protein